MLVGLLIVAMAVDFWFGISPLRDWVDDWFDKQLS